MCLLTTGFSANSSVSGAMIYQLDDGVYDSGVSAASGDSIVLVNQFNVAAGERLIEFVDAVFNENVGLSDDLVTGGIWADPNNDGDPTDAVLIGTTVSQAIAPEGGLHRFMLTNPVDVGSDGTSFFAGIWFQNNSPGVVLGRDSDGATGRSWIDVWFSVPPNPNDLSDMQVTPSDSDYMIRAGTVPEPTAIVLLGVGGVCLMARRRRV